MKKVIVLVLELKEKNKQEIALHDIGSSLQEDLCHEHYELWKKEQSDNLKELMKDKANKKTRIKDIKRLLDKDFVGLKIGKFAYCESTQDYVVAGDYGNSIEACIEITRNKKKYVKEHKQLNIFHSYCLELQELGGLDF